MSAATSTRRVPAIIEGQRSIERPQVPLSSDDAFLYDLLGSEKTATGERVTYKSALSLDAVWRAVWLISSGVAKLPIGVYRREGDGKQRLADHPAFVLLERRPNEYMTPFTLKQTLEANALLHGNGYAAIVRRRGVPEELLPLDPSVTYPVRANGVLWYVTHANGELIRLAAEDVLHVKGLGYDGLQGYSVLSYAAEAIGLGLGQRKYNAKFFGGGARPGVVLEAPGMVKPEHREELRRSFERMHQGIENSHRVAILTNGLKLHPFTVNAKDSQLLESRGFTIREIANFFGLPPHKLGDTTRQGYASLEQENQSYLDDTLDPWLVTWEEECTAKLLSEAERRADTHLIEFNRSALVRADMAQRFTAYQTGLLSGFLSVDEVRGRENLNPLPEGAGRVFYRPLNVAVVDESGGVLYQTDGSVDTQSADGEPAGPAVDDPEALRSDATLDALRAPVRDAARRMARRLGVHVRKATRDSKTFLDAVGTLPEEHRATVVDAFASALAPAAAIRATTWTATQAADALIGGLKTDAEAVYSTFGPGEFPAAMETRVNKYETEWPEQLALRAVSWSK